jgi:heavy metal translocating P-type ATPase
MKINQTCTLCQEPVFSHPVVEGTLSFCCTGCHAVFNILSSRQQLEGFERHPIFLQAVKSGLISNPALLDMIHRQKQEIADGEREKLYLEIADMWCPSCADIIKLMVSKEKGVVNCVIDYATDLAAIEYSPRHLSQEQVIGAISSLGYHPMLLDAAERNAVGKDLYLRFIVAAFCALNAMMFAYPLYATYFSYDGEDYGTLFAWLSFLVSLPVITYSAWPIWRRWLNSMKTGIFGMETLVVIGVSAAFFLSFFDMLSGGTRVYYDSMSVIIAFVLLGKIIETKAKFSVKESMVRLTRSTPRRGRKRFPDGSLQFVLVKELEKGDALVAYPGEKITVDGIVVEGEGICDESLMTGEAVPVVKRIGDPVFSGTILVKGNLTYQMISSAEESALQKIIEMVERDIGHKSAYVRAADQIVRWFVPAVIAIALLAAVGYWCFPDKNDPHPGVTSWLRAMAVLLISCPCAIGIAAPTAESYLLSRLAAMGVVVRNRGCLPDIGKESVIIFDKTGTVTEGRYVVQSGLESLERGELAALHSLASRSMHPVSCGIARSLAGEPQHPVEQLEEVVGYGLRGVLQGQKYYLGSAAFLRQQQIEVQIGREIANEQVGSTVYFAKEGVLLAALFLGDKIRPEIQGVVSALKPTRSVLLSGDGEVSVAAVARQCGFDAWRSCCTPLEKRAFVEELRLKGGVVCVIGDGMNDAPALTAAHIGVSVASATDMSIQVSDILLTSENLQVIPKMRALAQQGRRIIRQNLFWAFFYNVIGIFLAAFGILSPIFAAFAMSISSLTVLFNARRLNSYMDRTNKIVR